MIDIKKVLGIEKLFETEEMVANLKNYIKENYNFVVMGYDVEYYDYICNREVELDLCTDEDDTNEEIVIHSCGNVIVELIYDSVVVNNPYESIFRMHYHNGHNIPVRIVCPDTLAYPKRGDVILGQIVAFASSIKKVDVLHETNLDITDAGNNNVQITAEIVDVDTYIFDLMGVKAEYWDITLRTDTGVIGCVIQKKDIDFVPTKDIIVNVDAVLSLDVGIRQVDYDKDIYNENSYNSKDHTGRFIREGFVPNIKNAQRALEKCIETGKYTRFAKTCANEILIFDIDGNNCVGDTQIADYLETRFQGESFNWIKGHIVSGKDDYYMGWDAYLLKANERKEELITFRVNSFGFVEELSILDPCEYTLGKDYEMNAIAMTELAMSENLEDILREYLSDGCEYESHFSHRKCFSADSIIDRIRLVCSRIDAYSKYTYDIVQTKTVLKDNDNIPEIYSGKWCLKMYQKGILAAILFIQLDSDNKISRILLSRDKRYLIDFDEPVDEEHIYQNNDNIIWESANSYATSMIKSIGYNIKYTEFEGDCWAYVSEKDAQEFAIIVNVDINTRRGIPSTRRCKKLMQLPIAKDRIALILPICLSVITSDAGEPRVICDCYGNRQDDPCLYTVVSINNKDIVVICPRYEAFKQVKRFVCAVNTQNIDVLEAITKERIGIADARALNHHYGHKFYECIFDLCKTNGKMKLAYVGHDDGVYTVYPYFDGISILSFGFCGDRCNIDSIMEIGLDFISGDILVDDECNDDISLTDYPRLKNFESMNSDNIDTYSVKLEFENGENRRVDIPVHTAPEINSDIFKIRYYIFTKKMFDHGRIVDHFDEENLEVGCTYKKGQGILFINGYYISTAKLYFGG